MALMIHRHDTGQPYHDREFRQGIQPASDVIREYIHAHADPTQSNRFSKTNLQHATESILQQKQHEFIRELMDAMKARRVLVRRQAIGAMAPHQVLSLLPRLLAQALQEGKAKYDPNHETKSHKDKPLPRVRAPWATQKQTSSLAAGLKQSGKDTKKTNKIMTKSKITGWKQSAVYQGKRKPAKPAR